MCFDVQRLYGNAGVPAGGVAVKLRVAKKIYAAVAREQGRALNEGRAQATVTFRHHRNQMHRAAVRLCRACSTHGKKFMGFWAKALNAELRTDDARRVR